MPHFKQPQVERLIRYVVIPVAGIGLAILLALLPGERPSLVFLAVSMMGIPFVTGRDKERQNGHPGPKGDADE